MSDPGPDDRQGAQAAGGAGADPAGLRLLRWTMTTGSSGIARAAVVLAAGDHQWEATADAPGAISALSHHHSKQDEFIYILEGTATLLQGDDEYQMSPGDCMGFKAGAGVASQLVNRSSEPMVYLEVGDRTVGDEVDYPGDDLKATQQMNGMWKFTHKDGRLY